MRELEIDWLGVGSKPTEITKPENKRVIKKTKTKTKPREREKEIRKVEENYASGAWRENPESLWDFERLLVENNQSAETYIKFMAYHLNTSNLTLARQVAERAINTISLNNIKDRLHVWVAYLNMEVRYGGDANEIFKRSIHSNDAPTMYMKMFHIYRKCGKTDLAIQTANEGISKHPTVIKLWVDLIKFYFRNEMTDALKELHKKASQRCSKKDYCYITSQIAMLHYQHGNASAGQDLFEKLLSENAKRMDIWQMYIDAHVKYKLNAVEASSKSKRAGSIEHLRNIFKRATLLKLKPKKMKIIFTKWLGFETDYGNEKSREAVRETAKKYVESITQ